MDGMCATEYIHKFQLFYKLQVTRGQTVKSRIYTLEYSNIHSTVTHIHNIAA